MNDKILFYLRNLQAYHLLKLYFLKYYFKFLVFIFYFSGKMLGILDYLHVLLYSENLSLLIFFSNHNFRSLCFYFLLFA